MVGNNSKEAVLLLIADKLPKSVSPLQEMFNMAGMELPEYLKGKSVDDENTSNNETDIIPSKKE